MIGLVFEHTMGAASQFLVFFFLFVVVISLRTESGAMPESLYR